MFESVRFLICCVIQSGDCRVLKFRGGAAVCGRF